MQKTRLYWDEFRMEELGIKIQRDFGVPVVLLVPQTAFRAVTRAVHGEVGLEEALEGSLMLFPDLHWRIRGDVVFIYDRKFIRERGFESELELDIAYGSDVMGEFFATKPLRVLGFAARTFGIHFVLDPQAFVLESEAMFNLSPNEPMGRVLSKLARLLRLEWKDLGPGFLARTPPPAFAA